MSAQCESVPKKTVPLVGTMAAVVANSDAVFKRIAEGIKNEELAKQGPMRQQAGVIAVDANYIAAMLVKAQQSLCAAGYQRDFNPHLEVAAYDLEIEQIGAGVLVIPKAANIQSVTPLSIK